MFVQYFDITFALLLMLPAVFGPQDESMVRHFLRWKPVAFVGLVSYGVYLWHLAWTGKFYEWTNTPLLHGNFWVVFAWAMGLSIASGAVSFYCVERPLQRLGGSTAVNRHTGGTDGNKPSTVR
jgi:peptidoglycan/LPS O-acetylase OafA/YrhL